MSALQTIWRNFLDLPRATTLSTVMQGFFVVLVGYTGPLLVVIQAGRAGGLTEPQISSWVWGVVLGNGVLAMLMSLYFRIPLAAPYSTAGAALLGVSLINFPLEQAVGAYIVVGLSAMLLGISGLFGRLVALIPQPIAMGMLAGVLLRFGLDLFKALPMSPLMVTAMIITFFILKRVKFRVPMIGALVVGVVLSVLAGDFQLGKPIDLSLTTPIFVMPVFSLDAILTLALPLFVVALSSQYIPGEAILRFYGYEPPINKILAFTGIGSIVVAFVGAHGMTLGAYTAAFIVSPDSHPDPDKRYAAGFYSGVWHIISGTFGATIVAFFSIFPPALVGAISGLALLGTIQSALSTALAGDENRDSAMVAFLCTSANFSLLGIGAPFWGLLAGILTRLILRYGVQQSPLTRMANEKK